MITDRSLPSAPLNAFLCWKSPASLFARVSLTMKTRPVPAGFIRPVLIAVLASLALVLGSSRMMAQANQSPPERLTYQGFLVDGNGVALGNSAPKNYDVIFRIFNDQSAGNLLWAEQQTVTVDKGYFSVLLGEGASTGEPRPLLSSIFRGPTASERYVGITVKGIGSGGSNVDILPRLRLLSSPYSFLAQNAVKLVQDTGADLITSSGNAVTVSGPLAATGITAGNISATSLTAGSISATTVSGSGSAITGLNANNITVGTLSNDRTTATAGNAPNSIVARDGAGGFIMGNLMATTVQTIGNRTTHQQGAYLEWNKGNGDGVTYLLNQRGLGAGGISFGEVSSANAITEGMRLTAAGNLGLGTSAPGLRLEVAGSVGISGGNFLEFGRGITKDGSAGKIGYATFTGNALDIVGAGTSQGSRRIKLWSEGGLTLDGALNVNTPAVAANFRVVDNFVPNLFTGGFQVFHPTDKGKYFAMWRYNQGVQLFATGGGFGNAGSDNSRAINWDGDGNWDVSSDRKLKKDIQDAEPMLDRALQVQVRRFRWKDSAPDSKLSMGVVAQELEPLFPDLVSEQPNPVTGDTNLAVGYSDFGLIAVKALQELKANHDAEIADLKAQMAELMKMNQALASRLEEVAAAVGKGQ
jgi:hypothetical protein